MTRRGRARCLAALTALVSLTALLAAEIQAGGRAPRARAQVQRSGPASHGSFGREPERYRQEPRRADPGPGRYHAAPPAPAGPVDPDPGPAPPPDPAPPPPVREERYERADRVEHRRARHRAWRRGTTLSYAEWVDYECGDAEAVDDGDDTLYECDGTWFIATYYGGEVIYTATDPPYGY